MEGSIDQHLGARLAEARRSSGISLDAAVAAISMSVPEYNAIESGNIRIPAIVIARLARLFERPVSWFYQGLPGQAVFDRASHAGSV